MNLLFIIGPPGSNTSNADFFANFNTQQAGPASVSFWYNTNPEDLISAGHAGSITFGGVESSRFTGPFTNFPIVLDRTYWGLTFDKATMGGAALPSFEGDFMFDTGTTKVILPIKMAASINKGIGARGTDQFIDCVAGPSLPAVSFFFAGIKTPLTLSGQQLYFNEKDENGKSVCKSIFEGDDSGPPLIGALFLRSFYTTWDYSNAQIGFARPVAEAGQSTKKVSLPPTSSAVPVISDWALLVLLFTLEY